MKIAVRYYNSEDNVLEIRFLRGKTLLYNIFYNVAGLSDEELLELKKEAVAKFCTVFPDISKKDVMKGFGAVDQLMYQLYKETFDTRGGARPNAGRKKGVKIKPATVVFARRVTPEEKEYLTKCLDEFRKINK